jgi:hypothetical protein
LHKDRAEIRLELEKLGKTRLYHDAYAAMDDAVKQAFVGG